MFSCGKTWMRVFVAAFVIGTPERRQPKCPHTGEELTEDGVPPLVRPPAATGMDCGAVLSE